MVKALDAALEALECGAIHSGASTTANDAAALPDGHTKQGRDEELNRLGRQNQILLSRQQRFQQKMNTLEHERESLVRQLDGARRKIHVSDRYLHARNCCLWYFLFTVVHLYSCLHS